MGDETRKWPPRWGRVSAAATILLGATACALPLMLGGAPEWTLTALGGLSVAAYLSWAAPTLVGRHRYAASAVFLPAALLVVWPLIQLIPLPPSLLAALAPTSAELRDFSLVPLGLMGNRSISLDPPSTWRAVARAGSLALLLFVAVQVGRDRVARVRLFMTAGALGLAFALCGFFHQLAGLEQLFGVITFRTSTAVLTPFGNANHLASFMLLTGTLCLGLAVHSETRDGSVGWGLAAVACGVTVFMTLSRWGIASLVITWAFVGGVVLAERRQARRFVVPLATLGLSVVGALGLLVEELLARAQTVSSTEALQHTKLAAWPGFWRALEATWRTGMGRGAFEVSFPRWQATELSATWTHPENIVWQLALELGVPMFLLLAAAGGWAAYRVVSSIRGGSLEAIALIGVAGVVLHDLFDFSLELNAVSVVATIVFGLVVGGGEGLRRHAFHLLAPYGGIAAMICIALGLALGFPTHLDADAALVGAIRAQGKASELVPASIRYIDRHPADWVLYANAANVTSTAGDASNALAWVNRWLFLRPTDTRAHQAAARALLRLGRRDQAFVELRTGIAARNPEAVVLAVALTAQRHDVKRLLVEDVEGLSAVVTEMGRQGRSSEALSLLDLAAGELMDGHSREVAAELAAKLSGDLAPAAEARRRFDALPPSTRTRIDFRLHEAQLLVREGHAEAATRAFEALVRDQPAWLEAGFELASNYAANRRLGEAASVLDRLQPFVSRPDERVQLLTRMAELNEGAARWGRALECWQAVIRMEPTRAGHRYRLARVYEKTGALHAALDAIREGRAMDTVEGARAQDDWVTRLQSAQHRALVSETQE